MEGLVKGDVVVLSFPFTNLTATKKRPALVAANLDDDDAILCQITSKGRTDMHAIQLEKNDFEKGQLKDTSNIRSNKIFTANKEVILYKVGTIKAKKIKEVEEAVIKILFDRCFLPSLLMLDRTSFSKAICHFSTSQFNVLHFVQNLNLDTS